MSDRVIVSGPTGGSPNRLEIRDFVKNEKFFSLYIQALQAIQKEKESETLSYFQIGGIHSLPYVTWNGVEGRGTGGYCTHGTVLFPTWHRPYISIYEQIVQDKAKQIAATYTVDTAGWTKAANDLRQPYWDWAVNAIPPDEVIALEQVTIVAPNGNNVNVTNPLYQYAFQSPHFEGTEFSQWPTTYRYPTTIGGVTKDDVARLREVLTNEQESITTDTYHMLTRIKTWDAFSNHTASQDDSLSNSLEAIHDNIHDKVGGGGNMSFVPVAGFDPVFYLHHCNVDRMLSLWGALNPAVWVTPGDSGEEGTRTIPPNTSINNDTDLTPFYDTSTTFWASSGISDTTRLGYSYPEFNGLDLGNKDAVRDAIGRQVKQLYEARDLAGSSAAINTAQSALRAAPSNNNGLLEWTARVESKQFELPISYTVLLFLGEVSDDTKEWPVSPNFVGCHSAFVNSAAKDCGNCRNNADAVIEGYIHLNQGILRHSGLQSLEPDAVIPYLTKNLQWRVLKLDGERANLESLEVTVYSTLLKHNPATTFPDQETPKRYDVVTRGRDGGSRHAPNQ